MTTTLQPAPNPQLKRIVYSKYREMLGSYNDKANTIIQALPSYLVHEDKGFNITDLVENPRDGYGAPPPPPPPVMGSIPATRLQTQLPPEAPACVQNAMMTKDKKPFTYTPGGIDLSQIKSPRMAKRISRNANSEGVTGYPKMSPLAQQPNTPGVQPPTPPCLPSGMPVQVFPTGPPQPPPPPPPQAKLSTQNGINGNKSPDRKSPQSFEPPPFGCRPEIKIPPNPMANLRPTPKPQPKDDFWVEEYRRERSKSPVAPQQSAGQSNNVAEKQNEAPTRVEAQKPQISQKPSSPVNVVPKRVSPIRSPSPPTSRQVQPPSPVKTQQQETPLMTYNNVAPAAPAPAPVAPAKEQSPIRIAVKSQNATNQRAQSPIRQTPPQSPPQKNAQLGSLYIPPVQDQMANRQHLLNQQTPPWMQSRHVAQKETPEWVNRDEAPKVQQNQTASNPRERIIPIQLEQTPTPTKTPMTPGFGPQPFYNVAQQYSSVQSSPTTYSPPTYSNPNQFVDQGYNNINYANQAQNQAWSQQNAGQRIIPISIDGQSPDNSFNVRGPVSQQPTMIRSDPRSPQNLPQPPWIQPNQSKSFRILQQMTDTIADGNASEEEAGPAELQQPHYSRPLGPADMNENQLRKLQLTENDRALMNRVKNQVDQETYLHTEEDPRYRGAAIPSKAFKLLQNMTDGGQAYDNQVPQHRANPRFAQQRAMFQPNEGENQVYVHPSEQHVPEPKIYTGSAIPSRSFKMLQAMTTPENAGPGQSDL